VEASAAVVQADGQVTPEEAELVRVVAASLGVPVPPVATVWAS
jgi:tellurite resistance protein